MTPRLVLITLLFCGGCPEQKSETAPAHAAVDAAMTSPTGIDTAGMDKSVAPGDDFFAFANGGWLKSTAIPDDRSSWGSGAILDELTTQRTRELITGNTGKIGDYYAA